MPAQKQENLVEHLATEEDPFHFVDSGLDNVYLVGIKYFTSPDGRVVAEIPALKQLMKLIAHDLVKSPLDLTGPEIKFLRKRLGQKATEYCKYLGVEPETLSRIENGKQAISTTAEKLARLSYTVLSNDLNLKEVAIKIVQSMVDDMKDKKSRERIVLQMSKDHEWHELPHAA